MHIVIRFDVADDLADELERHLDKACQGVVENFYKEKITGTPLEQAQIKANHYSVYQTEASTAYSEVVEELATDAASESDLDLAIDELRNDVKEHPLCEL